MTDESLPAVILAAGEGRRLEPLTNRRPKPMLPVVNRPLLEHVVDAVVAAGIDEIVLVVGYERDRIQTHFGDGDDWDVSIDYAIQETQLGTAHALKQAESHVDGPFLTLNGDRIIDPSIVTDVCNALLDDATTAMAVSRSPDPSTYGVVTLEDDHLGEIVEKPPRGYPSDLINAGVYGFSPGIFDEIRETDMAESGELRLTDTIARLLEADEVRAVRYEGRWLDVSYLWDLLSVTGQVLDREGGATEGTVGPGAYVSEAARVGSTASIGANAIVGRGTTVAENARIGPNVTIERSVVFPDATVEAGAVLRDCIVGANATIGANVTVPGGEATVVVEGEVNEDVVLGGVVGDNASVGGGAVLEPGTVLGDEVTVGGGVTVDGVVDDRTDVRRG